MDSLPAVCQDSVTGDAKLVVQRVNAGHMPDVLLDGGTVTGRGHATLDGYVAVAHIKMNASSVRGERWIGAKDTPDIGGEVLVATQYAAGSNLLSRGI